MDTRSPLGPLKYGVARNRAVSPEKSCKNRRLGQVSVAYSLDYEWRSQGEFFNGLATIDRFLKRDWMKGSNCKHTKTVWCCSDRRVAVRFEYEWYPPQAPDPDRA